MRFRERAWPFIGVENRLHPVNCVLVTNARQRQASYSSKTGGEVVVSFHTFFHNRKEPLPGLFEGTRPRRSIFMSPFESTRIG